MRTYDMKTRRQETKSVSVRSYSVQIGSGSSATVQNLLKLNFDHGQANNNGNPLSRTNTVPTAGVINILLPVKTTFFLIFNYFQSARSKIAGSL